MSSSDADTCLYTRYNEHKLELIIMIYVDYIIIITDSNKIFHKAKARLNDGFDMLDLGKIRWFLGIRIIKRDEGIYMTQTAYIDKIVDQFIVSNAKHENMPLTPGDD